MLFKFDTTCAWSSLFCKEPRSYLQQVSKLHTHPGSSLVIFKLSWFPSPNSSANSNDMVATLAEQTQPTFSLLLRFHTAPDLTSPAALATATLTAARPAACSQLPSQAPRTSHPGSPNRRLLSPGTGWPSPLLPAGTH